MPEDLNNPTPAPAEPVAAPVAEVPTEASAELSEDTGVEETDAGAEARVALADDPEYQKLVRADAKKLFRKWKRGLEKKQSQAVAETNPTAPVEAAPPVTGPGTHAHKKPWAINRVLRRIPNGG